jgi:hypothetical protein
MMVIMTVVGSETFIRPQLRSSPEQRGWVDLSRTCIQATAVTLYLALLCGFKPYVNSRLRRWKLWVTACNQGATLLLILTRLLAEQARATTTENPAIFTASLVFMYVQRCVVQEVR